MNISSHNGTIIFKKCLDIIKHNPALLIFAIFSTGINFLLLICIGHPTFHYFNAEIQSNSVSTLEIIFLYIILLSYYYIRNVVNAWLGNALLHCCSQYATRKTYVRASLKIANKHFLSTWRLITLLSFTSFFFRYFQWLLIKFKRYQRLVGGGSMLTATLFTPFLISTQPLTIRAAMHKSSELFITTWGKPRHIKNYSLASIHFKLLVCCLVPLILAFTLNQPYLLHIGVAISVLCYLSLSCLFKVMRDLITYSLYLYASEGKITNPLTERILESAFESAN